MEQMMFFKDSTTIQPNGAYHITERRALAAVEQYKKEVREIRRIKIDK